MSSTPKQARSALALLDRRMRRALAGSADRAVDGVADRVQALVPRATGELADSMEVRHVAGGDIAASVAIGGGLEHPGEAAAVEFGTARVAPQPFFRPACTQGTRAAIADMHRSIHLAI